MANPDVALRQTSLSPKFTDRFRAFWKRYGAGYLLFLPFGVLFTLFVLVPVIIAMVMSLTYFNNLQPPRFIGLVNYRGLLLEDDIFLLALRNTMLFAVITGPLGYGLSFIAAWTINELKMRNAFALAFYAPSITSSIAMTVVWLWFFSGDRYGLVNNILITTGIINEPVLWNLSQNTILPVVMVIQVWMSMGTGFLVFLAGLQNVPQELYDAGDVDGIKSRFQRMWYITLPFLMPQMLFGAINSIVRSFAVFEVSVAVAGLPSPNYAGHTIVAHLFDHAFIRFELGYASAIAVVLFLLTFLLGRLAMKIFKSRT
ncbi:MAG: sugar ABC transporter permease [Spirochaetales bacterium]|jgi:multiple sugar transport system permease protein|nr:sugar ABC transporter permease [Spirochaetales bacterium]